MLVSQLSASSPSFLLQSSSSASPFLTQQPLQEHHLPRLPSSFLFCSQRGAKHGLCTPFKQKHGLSCRLSFTGDDALEGYGQGDVEELKIEEGIFESVRIFEQESVDEGAGERSLIPAEWKSIQEELNKPKAQKRKEIRARQEEFVRNKKLGERAIMSDSGGGTVRLVRNQKSLAVKRRDEFRVEKRGLQNFDTHWRDGHVVIPDEPEPEDNSDENGNDEDSQKYDPSQRAIPVNPRLLLGDDTLEDLAKRMEDFGAESKEPEEIRKLNKVLSAEEKSLLKAKVPDLEKLTGKKWLPLHTLAASGRTIIVAELLSHGVDINATDKDGLTALHKAISSGKETVVKQLIRAGADVSVKDKEGASLLHYAAHYGYTNIAKVLLKNKVDVNHPDNDGWTPLHVAVPGGRTELIKLLLKYGADKDLVNQDGNRPLDIALAFGRGFYSYHIVKVLKFFPKEESCLDASSVEETKGAFLIPTM